LVASTRQTDSPIINASLVRIARTANSPASGDISGAFSALRRSSNSTAMNRKSEQMQCRTGGEFSPTPPKNTIVSNPPGAAANTPMRTHSSATNSRNASAPARRVSRSSKSRMSELVAETPDGSDWELAVS
jgi:hypothetical protein